MIRDDRHDMLGCSCGRIVISSWAAWDWRDCSGHPCDSDVSVPDLGLVKPNSL